jgi:hypothetical protein
MRTARTGFLVLALVLFSPLVAHAASQSTLGRWFGFGSDSSKSAAKTSNVPGKAGILKTPQVVTKMGSGTKRLVSNTTSMLTPKKTTTRKSGTTGMERAKKPQEEKPGFFQSLFHPEPPPPPKTIKEWMSLKQIHP